MSFSKVEGSLFNVVLEVFACMHVYLALLSKQFKGKVCNE